MSWSRLPALAIAFVLGSAAPGFAQVGTLDGAICVDAEAAYCTRDSDCLGMAGSRNCRGGACLRDSEVICCSDGFVCPDEDYRCFTGAVLSGASVCLSPDDDYCVDDVSLAEARTIRPCHTAPDNRAPVPWLDGDCDQDGIPNWEELLDGSDVCLKERGQLDRGPLGLVCDTDLEICEDRGEPCETEDGAAGTCFDFGNIDECIEDGVPTCCSPELNIFCQTAPGIICRAPVDGPVGACIDRDYDLCEPIAELTEAQLTDCLTAPSGRSPVEWPLGDCDGDGFRNGVEAERDSDPCTFDDPPDQGPPPEPDQGPPAPDFGPPAVDQGPLATDAGPPGMDAGIITDGQQPSFGGAAGCTCRVGAPEADTPLGLAGGLLLGVALVLRRRRR